MVENVSIKLNSVQLNSFKFFFVCKVCVEYKSSIEAALLVGALYKL